MKVLPPCHHRPVLWMACSVETKSHWKTNVTFINKGGGGEL